MSQGSKAGFRACLIWFQCQLHSHNFHLSWLSKGRAEPGMFLSLRFLRGTGDGHLVLVCYVFINSLAFFLTQYSFFSFSL